MNQGASVDSPATTFSFVSHSAEETRALGARIGRISRPGDLICLIGDLGAGKTTFAQGIAAGLDLPEEEPVNSPTFTLVAEHLGGRLPFNHFDVYRLAGSRDLREMGFEEYLDGRAVVAIEWADRIEDALPPDRLTARLELGANPDERALTLSTCDGAWAARLLDEFGVRP